MAAENLQPLAGPAAPLVELLETYGCCLDLSRQYAAENKKPIADDEFDTDRLENFIAARADLFALAENSFKALAEYGQADPADAGRAEMTGRVVALLKEMTEVENQLSAFLGDRLEKMRSTLKQMRTAQPVFKRYAHLGGDKIAPNRINRHS